jgi:protein-tyrosine phosphatase
VPIGGSSHPYRPEAVEALRQRLAAAKGRVLVHCASGGRSSLVWAAYAVKYLGLSPDEAMRTVAQFDDSGWSNPLEKLSDIPMVLERRAPK